MGQAESQPQAGGAQGGASAAGGGTLAFHVLRVAENSPAAEAGVEPFFDFIVGAAGRQLGDDLDLLTDVLEENEGGEVPLQIYSTKRKEIREVYVVPSRTWSSAVVPGSTAGSVDGQPSLLGLSLRLCNPHHALDQVWHVLEILEGSPAQSAGLVPFGDWIVGYAGGVLHGEGDFYDVVEAHVDKPLRLFVYNSDYDVTREAILVPNRNWGGEGLLGCGVGYGLLHRIPKPQDRARPTAQTYDTPYAAAPPPPVQRQPPLQQQQQQQRSPPPKTDRLRSFSSTSGTLPNPLYAPPPPRASAAPTPPRAPAEAPAAPQPPRRTAALASYDEHGYDEHDRSNDPYAHEGSHEDDHGSYALDGSHGYESHPSFAHYGAYDASEGVEVIPVQVDDGDEEGDFQGGYGRQGGYEGGYARPYGAGSFGAARVVAE